MSTAVAPPRDVIKHFARTSSRLARGSSSASSNAVSAVWMRPSPRKYTGSHPSENLRLFGAYHDVMLLLGE